MEEKPHLCTALCSAHVHTVAHGKNVLEQQLEVAAVLQLVARGVDEVGVVADLSDGRMEGAHEEDTGDPLANVRDVQDV
jgi:hypothetical protein